MQYAELPPALKAQVDAKLGGKPGRKKPRTTSKAVAVAESPGRGSCSCGLQFDRFNAWEKHSRTEGNGHRRFTLAITEAP